MEINGMNSNTHFGNVVVKNRAQVMKCINSEDCKRILDVEKEFKNYKTKLLLNLTDGNDKKAKLVPSIVHYGESNNTFTNIHDFEYDKSNNLLSFVAENAETQTIFHRPKFEQNQKVMITPILPENPYPAVDFSGNINPIDAAASVVRSLENKQNITKTWFLG